MPIATPPAKLPWIQPQALVNAAMPGPLPDVLDATNHLYWRHRPAWLSHAVSASIANASQDYVIPVPEPSADGLIYDVRVTMLAAAVGTCTLRLYTTTTLNPTTAVWSPVASSSPFALVNGYAVASWTPTIPAATTMVKLAITATTTACKPSHVFACPSPSSTGAPFASGGVTASGFRVHDGTLLGTSGQPVTQELVDRCHRNSAAIVRDRRQVIASLLSPWQRSGNTLKAPQPWTATGAWVTVGRGVCQLPTQAVGSTGQQTVTIRVHASRTGGGSTADLVQVGTLGAYDAAASVLFAADDVAHTATMTVTPDQNGWISWRVQVRGGAGQSVYVHAVTIDWQAGADLDPAMRLTGTQPITAATSTLLATAWACVRDRAMAAYAAVAHMVDASTSGRETVVAHVAVSRGVRTLRLLTHRCGDTGPAVPVPTYLYGQTDGSIATPANAARYNTNVGGVQQYWGVSAVTASPATQLVTGGEATISSPSGYQDRALNVTEDLITSIELVKLQNSAGWTLYHGELTPDPSTL